MYIDNENFDKWMEFSFPAESIFPNPATLSGKWQTSLLYDKS